jgi:twitching motility protein PilT
MATTNDAETIRFLSKQQEFEIDKLFRALVKLDGSDLHLKVGLPPHIRVDGVLRPLNREPVNEDEIVRLVFPMLNMEERRKRGFDEDGGVDFAYGLKIDGKPWRFRVNAFQQSGHVGMVARRVNNTIPDFKALNLPPQMEELCKYSQGIILLSGITGCGKSTTIAAMLDWINHHYRRHILTIEDPIEFTFTEDKCIINQREIGIDVKDFSVAMKHAVREDPDVILLGEMRDGATFETAIAAAETGHLVFGTIHASTAPSTIGRIMEFFPQNMHSSIRSSLAFNMKAIVVQKLLPSIKEGVGRIPACEIMTFSQTVRKLLLDQMDEKLSDAIRLGRDDGMQDFAYSLKELVENEFIERPVAFEAAPNADALKMALKGIEFRDAGMI